MRKVCLVLGMTGEGKTTLSKTIRARFPRSITLDPRGEYGGEVFTDFRSMYDRLAPVFDTWEQERFKLVARFRSDADVNALFKFCNLVYDLLLVVEETESYLNPKRMNRDYLDLIMYGRHIDVSLLAVARRSMELCVDLRAQATSIYTFRQIEPRDLVTAAAYGFDPAVVTGLPPHHYAWLHENLLAVLPRAPGN